MCRALDLDDDPDSCVLQKQNPKMTVKCSSEMTNTNTITAQYTKLIIKYSSFTLMLNLVGYVWSARFGQSWIRTDKHLYRSHTQIFFFFFFLPNTASTFCILFTASSTSSCSTDSTVILSDDTFSESRPLHLYLFYHLQ